MALLSSCVVLCAWAGLTRAGPTHVDAQPAACSSALVASLQPGDEDGASSAARHANAASTDAQTCKPWPYDPAITLASIACVVTTTASTDDECDIELVTAMVEAANGRVLAVHRERVQADATLSVGDHPLRLGTARHDLAPGVRAIGRVVHSDAHGASSPDAGPNDQITLFVRDGRRLRPVMSTFLSGWSGALSRCTTRTSDSIADAAITIGVGQVRNKGDADLELVANVDTTVVSASGAERTQRRRARRVLRYDGASDGLDPYQNLYSWSSDREAS